MHPTRRMWLGEDDLFKMRASSAALPQRTMSRPRLAYTQASSTQASDVSPGRFPLCMESSLDNLPVELYLAIISHFHPHDCQQSLLSLSRAIPRSPVPTHILFENILLRHPDQIFRLYTHLRRTPDNASRVRSVSLESWAVDADVFVNLMALLPTMERLRMFVGPNFAPEHMEEIFHGPREGLQFISMRFRP